MKKSFGILWVLMALAVFMALPAAAQENDSHPHSMGHCVCCGNVEGHGCIQITKWTALEGEVNFGLLDSGYYYLTGDVTSVAVTDQFVGRVTKNSDGSYTCTKTTSKIYRK